MAGLLWWFVPFTQMWVALDWRLHYSDREQVAARVLDGSLRPNVSCCPTLIALGPAVANVSAGNEISVEEHRGQTYVFFYTGRGFLDNYSGFLFVSGDGDPRAYADLTESTTRLVRWAPKWYWVAHG